VLGEAEIYVGLTEIFRDVFARDDLVLRPEMTATDIEGWDSFKQVEIIIAAEERFTVRFTTRDIDGLNNVGDLVRAIAARSV
jgi:acyl carrier protein